MEMLMLAQATSTPWLIGGIAGAAAGGLVGAIVVTPLVGVVKVVIGALRSNEFPGRATSSGTG